MSDKRPSLIERALEIELRWNAGERPITSLQRAAWLGLLQALSVHREQAGTRQTADPRHDRYHAIIDELRRRKREVTSTSVLKAFAKRYPRLRSLGIRQVRRIIANYPPR